MILPRFDYAAPATLPEALDLLAARGENAGVLAGGTDLLVLMKEKKLHPSVLMSIKRLSGMRVLSADSGKVRVGAGLTVADIAASDLAKESPAFGDLRRLMATPQIRNRATLGGNLCTAAACADFPPILLINDAVLHLSSRRGTRKVPIKEFFVGPRRTVKAPDELLVEVECRGMNAGSAYVKAGVRNAANIAVVAVAAGVELENGMIRRLRVAVTAASPVPLLAEEAAALAEGMVPGREAWERVAEAVPRALKPISDLRGSDDYRLHLAWVCTVRALEEAHRRWEAAAHA